MMLQPPVFRPVLQKLPDPGLGNTYGDVGAIDDLLVEDVLWCGSESRCAVLLPGAGERHDLIGGGVLVVELPDCLAQRIAFVGHVGRRGDQDTNDVSRIDHD